MVTHINDRALYPDDPHKSKSTWFPFSQVKSIRRNPDGNDEVRVKEWIVLKTEEFENLLRGPSNDDLQDEEADRERSMKELDGLVGFTPSSTVPYKGTGGSRARENDDDYEDDVPF